MSKKICILIDSLSSGGAEKVAANMSISLSKKEYSVFLVTMINNIDYRYKGELYNFGLIKEKYSRFKAFLKFKKYFKENDFDIIIDHRVRNKFFKELIFSKNIFCHSKVIYCIHSYKLDNYFSFLNTSWLAVLPHVKNRLVVSVSNEIKVHIEKKLKLKSKTIYNYLNFDDLKEVVQENKVSTKDYIIGVGRLTEIKQFDKLIKSYHASRLRQKNIKLIILGDGPERKKLEVLISKLQLENFVELLPFQKPYGLIHKAKALVLTSKTEGFPMVLLEAAFLKTPMIAFNCKSGPSEIIVNKQNGLLIEDQNEEELTLALNKLLLDDSFYNKIKVSMHIGLEKFYEENIIQEWINLFENQR